MSATSGSLRNGQNRRSTVVEKIPSYMPTVRTPVKAKLDSCTRFPSLKTVRYVSTSISPSGLLAACVNRRKAAYVRIYSVSGLVDKQTIQAGPFLKLRKEEILEIALSDELLVVLTYGGMLVYEHRAPQAFKNKPLDQITFGTAGQNAWTPHAVSIFQTGSVTAEAQRIARIVVGGEGNEARVYTYTHLHTWIRRKGRAELVPHSSQRSGSIRLVGFSPASLNRPDRFMVVGVSTVNHVFCWDIDLRREDSPSIECGWNFNCSPGRDKAASIGCITSATLFASPSGLPYLFCTINQRYGSPLIRSFITPMDLSRPTQTLIRDQLRVLPDEEDGGIAREVLYGTVSPNGLFLVAVEAGRIRVLAIQGSYHGGLTCRKILSFKDAVCKSPLIETGHYVSTISMSVREQYGVLEVMAVDGRGHVVELKINVENMPPASIPTVPLPEATVLLELPQSSAPGELGTGESSRCSGSSASRERNEGVDSAIAIAR